MPTDHRARVEEALADYRRSRERLAEVRAELAGIVESATSTDDTVSVTVGPQGTLRDLRIAENAYERQRPSQLAATIVGLADKAARAAAVRAEDVLAPALSAGTDPASVLEGRADLDPGEPMRTPASGGHDNGRVEAAEDERTEGDFPAEDGWLQGGRLREDPAKRRHR